MIFEKVKAGTKGSGKCIQMRMAELLFALSDGIMIGVKYKCQHQYNLDKWGGGVCMINWFHFLNLIICFPVTYTCITKYIGAGKLLLCFSTGRACIWWPHCTTYSTPVISRQLPLREHITIFIKTSELHFHDAKYSLFVSFLYLKWLWECWKFWWKLWWKVT